MLLLIIYVVMLCCTCYVASGITLCYLNCIEEGECKGYVFLDFRVKINIVLTEKSRKTKPSRNNLTNNCMKKIFRSGTRWPSKRRMCRRCNFKFIYKNAHIRGNV